MTSHVLELTVAYVHVVRVATFEVILATVRTYNGFSDLVHGAHVEGANTFLLERFVAQRTYHLSQIQHNYVITARSRWSTGTL